MRFLGIDYGSSWIGLATGDDESCLAVPYDTLGETDFHRQVEQISRLVLDEEIDEVIVGYPLTLEGGESAQTAETIEFIETLNGKLAVPVRREDERLSSSFAQSLKREYGGGTHDEHALAAAGILQTFLDRKKQS